MKPMDRASGSRTLRVQSLATFASESRRRVLRTIWRWELQEYGATQSRRLAAIKGRLRRYDEGVLCAVDGARLLGFADVVPLAPSHYGALRKGRVIEEQIPSRWVNRESAGEASCWYIGSLIVARSIRSSQPGLAHDVSARLQRAIWSFIATRGRPPFRVLGISATQVGQAKFRQTGFLPVAPAVDAMDARPRFEQVFPRRAGLAARAAERPRRARPT